jgi:hypothetical protein
MANKPLERKSPEALIDDLKTIVAANVAGNMELLARVGTLLSHAGQVISALPLGRPPDGSAIVTRGIDLTLASTAIVSEHTLAMLNDLVSVAERTLAALPQSSATHDEPPEPQTPVRLEGRRGERVAGQFAVDNQYDCPVQVSFGLGALTAAQAPPIPAARIALDPVSLVIGPQASQIVDVTIDITEEFVVGQTYTTTVRVVGFRAPDILVHLAVLGPNEQSNAAQEVARTKRPVTRKRKAR